MANTFLAALGKPVGTEWLEGKALPGIEPLMTSSTGHGAATQPAPASRS
jgi:hypothetical protein